jgi:hypothetical protein
MEYKEMETRREVEETAEGRGLPPSAVSLIAAATAAGRHDRRIEATKETFRRQYGADWPLFLSLDLHGVGGPQGATGEGTERFGPGGFLGKGRWLATDGQAYRAAAEAALWRAAGSYPQALPVWSPEDRDWTLQLGGERLGDDWQVTTCPVAEGGWPEVVAPSLETVVGVGAGRWAVAYARHAVLLLAGVEEEWGSSAPSPAGSLQRWGEFLEAAEDALRGIPVRPPAEGADVGQPPTPTKIEVA